MIFQRISCYEKEPLCPFSKMVSMLSRNDSTTLLYESLENFSRLSIRILSDIFKKDKGKLSAKKRHVYGMRKGLVIRTKTFHEPAFMDFINSNRSELLYQDQVIKSIEVIQQNQIIQEHFITLKDTFYSKWPKLKILRK